MSGIIDYSGWITQTEYEEQYHGSAIPDDDFGQITARAAQQVDMACCAAISHAGGVDKLEEWRVKFIKTAVCIQAEYLLLNGVESATDGAAAMDGYNIGDTSVTLHAGSGSSKESFPGGVCAAAYAMLVHAGLMYRGVKVCSF